MSKDKRVKIAIIDSGISDHKKIVLDRIKYKINIKEDGIDDNVEDLSGHGTAITSILCSKSEYDLYILKILDKHNEATTNQLIKALKIAVDMNVDIINLSLGTEDFSEYHKIKSICDEAEQKGIFIVSACNNKNKDSLPYNLDTVLKVKPYLCVKNNDVFYYNGIFIAKGMPSLFPGLNGGYELIGGSSFSAPYITLKLAEAIAKCKGDYSSVKKYFINQCKKVKHIPDFYPINSLRKIDYIKNIDLYNKVSLALENILGNIDKNVSLLDQGMNATNTYTCLKTIEKLINYKLPYDEFCLEDFLYKENLTEKIDLIINRDII